MKIIEDSKPILTADKSSKMFDFKIKKTNQDKEEREQLKKKLDEKIAKVCENK